MQKLLYFGLSIYFLCYVFESPLRYALSLRGADSLIFIRDVLLFVPLVILFTQQVLRKKVHPAFYVFLCIIALHGLVMVLNTHSILAVAYSVKVFMGMLAGAIASPFLFSPSRRVIVFFLFLWGATALGIVLDKFYVEFPWTGMETTIGDTHVDISRDWQITGEDKRAGGFMRSSINAAIVTPLIALILLFNCKNMYMKAFVALGTVMIVSWTTQKGSLIAYSVILGLMVLAPKWQFSLLRLGFFAFTILMVALPLALPGYHMPNPHGALNIGSFNLRVEQMWPDGWSWIARNQIFPFGIGLGGLGGGQRMWSGDDYTAGDNMYIFMYANFGMMTFVYLGWLSLIILRLNREVSQGKAQAMATLAFLMGYGCVLSLIEDQMALLFSGAAVAWLANVARQEKMAAKEEAVPPPIGQLYAKNVPVPGN